MCVLRYFIPVYYLLIRRSYEINANRILSNPPKANQAICKYSLHWIISGSIKSLLFGSVCFPSLSARDDALFVVAENRGCVFQSNNAMRVLRRNNWQATQLQLILCRIIDSDLNSERMTIENEKWSSICFSRLRTSIQKLMADDAIVKRTFLFDHFYCYIVLK